MATLGGDKHRSCHGPVEHDASFSSSLPIQRPPLDSAFGCLGVRSGAFASGVLGMITSFVFIGLSTIMREDSVKAGDFKYNQYLMTTCTVWVPVDRVLVFLTSVFMILGVSRYDQLLIQPYLWWGTLNKVVNAVLCIMLASVIGQMVYIAWLVVCFETYSLCIVYSEYLAIPRKFATTQAYLDKFNAVSSLSEKTEEHSFALSDKNTPVQLLRARGYGSAGEGIRH